MKYKMIKSGMLAVAIACTTFFSCNKEDDNNASAEKATMRMHLTDGPADYDAIYLDIQQVEVTMSGSSPLTLIPIRPGIYDILHFRNGLDTLLIRADIPPGTIQQIRLILGNNNSIVVNGISHPLSTPSAQESGVKLNLHETFVAGGAYDIWIDFDAGKSILQTGNGSYKLKPVIRAYSALTDGRIKGYVLPLTSYAIVYAINGTDTFAAIPDPINGYFRISGLPAATYQVWIDAGIGYQDLMLNNVSVAYGIETDLGIKTLVP